MDNILKYQNPSSPLLTPKDTTDIQYLKFKETLPDNLRLTSEKDYHMYDYWRLNGKPKDFNQGIEWNMFGWDDSDKGWHAGSIAEDKETGIYHFMKPKHHPTVKYELDWFNKGLQTLEGGKQVPVEGEDKKFWEDFTSKYQLDTTGVDYRYVPIQKKGDPLRRPNFKESKEAYYDPETDTVFAPDSLGEFYHHEMFHARPNLQLLESLKPYYHNLNDDVLKQMGADLSFVKRFNNDPGHFYSPEELGARVVSASKMLNKMGVKNVTLDFLKNARLNENAYGDNFRDLVHMYNDENLIKIFNTVKKHENGGTIKTNNNMIPDIIRFFNGGGIPMFQNSGKMWGINYPGRYTTASDVGYDSEGQPFNYTEEYDNDLGLTREVGGTNSLDSLIFVNTPAGQRIFSSPYKPRPMKMDQMSPEMWKRIHDHFDELKRQWIENKTMR